MSLIEMSDALTDAKLKGELKLNNTFFKSDEWKLIDKWVEDGYSLVHIYRVLKKKGLMPYVSDNAFRNSYNNAKHHGYTK